MGYWMPSVQRALGPGGSKAPLDRFLKGLLKPQVDLHRPSSELHLPMAAAEGAQQVRSSSRSLALGQVRPPGQHLLDRGGCRESGGPDAGRGRAMALCDKAWILDII